MIDLYEEFAVKITTWSACGLQLAGLYHDSRVQPPAVEGIGSPNGIGTWTFEMSYPDAGAQQSTDRSQLHDRSGDGTAFEAVLYNVWTYAQFANPRPNNFNTRHESRKNIDTLCNPHTSTHWILAPWLTMTIAMINAKKSISFYH